MPGGRPAVDWSVVVTGIRQHGIRNAAQTTVAPTGTIATVAGCEGYGCEPVFALAYIRHVNDKGKDLQLTYASPAFETALQKLGIEPEKREEILAQIMREGSCQHVAALPQAVRDTFVVSADITAEEHVRMQAALQAFVDNSLSKTVNFPPGASEEDVATAYMLAWELGCKGITVYVTGSRDKVVLETHGTADAKTAPAKEPAPPRTRRPRPGPGPRHPGRKRAACSSGTRPRNPARSSSPATPTPSRPPWARPSSPSTKTAAASPSKSSSTAPRPAPTPPPSPKPSAAWSATSCAWPRPSSPLERLKEVSHQLGGIGGGRSLGFGPNRVRSLPDGIGQILERYLDMWHDRKDAASASAGAGLVPAHPTNGANGNGTNGHSRPEKPAGRASDLALQDRRPLPRVRRSRRDQRRRLPQVLRLRVLRVLGGLNSCYKRQLGRKSAPIAFLRQTVPAARMTNSRGAATSSKMR